MNVIVFDSYIPPEAPTDFKVNLVAIESDDSVRSETGVKLLNVVRDGIHKIEIVYSSIHTSTLTGIAEKILQETIDVTFFLGVYKTATMRATNRDTTLVSLIDGGLWNLSLTLEEL